MARGQEDGTTVLLGLNGYKVGEAWGEEGRNDDSGDVDITTLRMTYLIRIRETSESYQTVIQVRTSVWMTGTDYWENWVSE